MADDKVYYADDAAVEFLDFEEKKKRLGSGSRHEIGEGAGSIDDLEAVADALEESDDREGISPFSMKELIKAVTTGSAPYPGAVTTATMLGGGTLTAGALAPGRFKQAANVLKTIRASQQGQAVRTSSTLRDVLRRYKDAALRQDQQFHKFPPKPRKIPDVPVTRFKPEVQVRTPDVPVTRFKPGVRVPPARGRIPQPTRPGSRIRPTEQVEKSRKLGDRSFKFKKGGTARKKNIDGIARQGRTKTKHF